MKVTLGDSIETIGYYEDVLSEELCELIIDEHLEKEDIFTSGVALEQEFVAKIYPHLEVVINDLLKNYIKDCDINSFPDDFGLEPFHVKGYRDDGETPEQYQIDVGSHDMARRFVGIFFMLNELDEPGEIKFYRQNKSIKPKRGSVFIFPSLWTHPQLRILPKTGTEWVMGTYLHYL